MSSSAGIAGERLLHRTKRLNFLKVGGGILTSKQSILETLTPSSALRAESSRQSPPEESSRGEDETL